MKLYKSLHYVSFKRLYTLFVFRQSDDKDAKAREVVQVVKGLQQLRGADGDIEEKDPMEETVGRRKTIQNLHDKHLLKKKQSVRTLDTALKRRLSMMPDNSGKNDYLQPQERNLNTDLHDLLHIKSRHSTLIQIYIISSSRSPN
jgi:hypothetical protein